MEYYIDIIDTDDNTHVTQLEFAERDSINLNYKGADKKDQISIVGSQLTFTLEVGFNNLNDAVFISLFTGDENKFRIELREAVTDNLLWSGFILPDSYNEPYTNGTYYVAFDAVDGLGRLKGKYLTDNYYSKEYNVVDIVAQCLKLTGLQMEIIFAPGVDNNVVKNWHKIYINTANFIEKEKRLDAYKILEMLTKDTVSCLYQQQNSWYFEGLNKRNLITYDARRYDYAGLFLNTMVVVKNIIDIKGKVLAKPEVTMVPPYNEITVNYERTLLTLPDNLKAESNQGWVLGNAPIDGLLSTGWYSNNIDFIAKTYGTNYKVGFELSNTDTFDNAKYVKMHERPYVNKDEKLKFELQLSLTKHGSPTSAAIDSLVSGAWRNFMRYSFNIGTQVVFTNNTPNPANSRSINFNNDAQATLTVEFIAPVSGIVDLIIYQPFGVKNTIKVDSVQIESIQLQQIDFEENEIVSDVIDANYTINKDVDLTFSANKSGIGKVFQLDKLQGDTQLNSVYYYYTILHAFQQNGVYYYQVSLSAAHAIKNSAAQLFYGSFEITDYEVIYNLNNGEQMVVAMNTSVPNVPGVTAFSIRVNYYAPYLLSRDNWDKWTDSVYQIEGLTYNQAVLGLYRRLFDVVQPKIDLNTEYLFIQFGDLIKWDYQEDSVYSILDSSLNLDSGVAALRLIKASYFVNQIGIPPIVDVGVDVSLTGVVSTHSISALAYDPDGTIVSVLWEQVSGDTTATIQSPNTLYTNFTGLTGNNYVFKITVTDNDGLTAFDTVIFTRVLTYEITLNLLSEVNINENGAKKKRRKERVYQVVVTPDLPANETLTLASVLDLQTVENTPNFVVVGSRIKVFKNGITVADHLVGGGDNLVVDEVFNYINTDIITVELITHAEETTTFAQGDGYAVATFEISEVTPVVSDLITNAPVGVTISSFV